MLFLISPSVKFKFNFLSSSGGKHIRPAALTKFKLTVSSPASYVSRSNKVEKYVYHSFVSILFKTLFEVVSWLIRFQNCVELFIVELISVGIDENKLDFFFFINCL